MVKELENFRAKYPDYNDLDDIKLSSMLASKYPDSYGDLPDKVKLETSVPNELISSRINTPMPEQTGEPKPFEQVASLKLGYKPGDGKPREGAEMASTISRNVLPVAGAIAGGMAGSGLMSVPGSGLGFAIGEQAAGKVDEFLGLKKPVPLAQEAAKAGKDVLTGSAMEMGGQVAMPIIGKGIDMTAKVLFDDLPQRLYASAIKMPLTKSWKKVLPGQEITKRTAAIKEGLSNSIPPSEFGLAKTKKLERETKTFIDSVTKKLSENPELDIEVSNVLKNSLDDLYKQTKGSDPEGANAAIDAVKEKFKAHGVRITPNEANSIKRRLYEEIKWSEANSESGQAVSGIYTNKAKQKIANDLMKRLEGMYPEIEKLNETDAARIFLTEAIENSVGRLQNNNMVPLGAKVLLSNPRTWIPAMWEATLGHPQIKARIAFALAKGNPKKYSQFIYPEMPPGYVPKMAEQPSEVYRYQPETQFTKSPIPPRPQITVREGEPPSGIKTKMQEALEAEEAERLRQLEIRFGRMEKERNAQKESKTGSPLIKPKNYTGEKTPIPETIENMLKKIK